MSCGRIALDRAGIPVTNYYASEVDKYATIVSAANYPDIIRLGDVTKWREWNIDWGSIDLILAGSPCQGFSFAGKRLAFDDPRSALFFTFVEILEHARLFGEVSFMLENVNMAARSLDVISYHLNTTPERINSAKFSAAMRDRQYWFNWEVFEPEGEAPDFQSILENGEARIPKAYALTATYHKKGAEHTRQRNFSKSQRPIAWLSDTETRWLTLNECEALMTVPKDYTNHVSNTQRYKMLGNGWTVDVIAHILRGLKREN